MRIVSGPVGVGKSAAVAWHLLRAPRDAAYVTAADLTGTPRNGWSANEERWSRWLSVDVLGVDDLGTEDGDPAIIRRLLTERWNRGLCTLGTANVSAPELLARYFDARLTDRVISGQEHKGAPSGLRWFVAVHGESLRNPAAAAALVQQSRGKREGEKG